MNYSGFKSVHIIAFILLAGFLFSCFGCTNFGPQKTDLTMKWDTIRPLTNPDKGWYHHMLDNGIGKYLIQDENRKLSFEIEWLNKGVAPAYTSCQLRGKLIPTDGNSESIEFKIEDSGNKIWMPDQTIAEKYTVNLSQKPKGEYWLAIQLFDTKWEIPVEIGLSTDLKVEEYFNVQNISF